MAAAGNSAAWSHDGTPRATRSTSIVPRVTADDHVLFQEFSGSLTITDGIIAGGASARLFKGR